MEVVPNELLSADEINSTKKSQYGRLANHLIRNLCCSGMAKKHNLKFSYSAMPLMKELGLHIYTEGEAFHATTIKMKENEFPLIMTQPEPLQHNLYVNELFLQTQDTARYIREALKQNQREIREANPYKDRYERNQDVFLHIRLGDIVNAHFFPKHFVEYLHNTLQEVLAKEANSVQRVAQGVATKKAQSERPKRRQFMMDHIMNFVKENDEQKTAATETEPTAPTLAPINIYIGSDTLNHKICLNLKAKFEGVYNVVLFNESPVKTMQFASTCKHIILSNGTFSWFIGVLAFNSTVYYPKIHVPWHGDIFVFEDWNERDANPLPKRMVL